MNNNHENPSANKPLSVVIDEMQRNIRELYDLDEDNYQKIRSMAGKQSEIIDNYNRLLKWTKALDGQVQKMVAQADKQRKHRAYALMFGIPLAYLGYAVCKELWEEHKRNKEEEERLITEMQEQIRKMMEKKEESDG